MTVLEVGLLSPTNGREMRLRAPIPSSFQSHLIVQASFPLCVCLMRVNARKKFMASPRVTKRSGK